MSCAKNTNFGARKNLFTRHFFIFLTYDTKDVGFLRNLACANRMLKCTQENYSNFFNSLKWFLVAGAYAVNIKCEFPTGIGENNTLGL
jgi:hypothetical protein